MTDRLMVGAVAYDPKVVPIWEGIREYFRGAPVEMDFVLFSNYEAQVEALLAGWIDIAWNTNLAYVRTHHATAGACRVLAMRDTDVGFLTLLVGPAGRARLVADLRGQDARARQRRLGAGGDHAGPLPRARGARPRRAIVQLRAVRLRRRQARRHGPQRARRRSTAVLDGRADAAAVGAASWDVFVRAGEVPPGAARALLDVAAVLALQLHRAAVARRPSRATPGPRHLRAMDWANPDHRRILELEGLREWVGPQLDGLPRRVRRRRGAGDRASVVTGRARGRRSTARTSISPSGSGVRAGRAACPTSSVGEVLELTSRNPGLAHELPAWCRGTGNELVARRAGR